MYKHLRRAVILIAFLALLACAAHDATRNDTAHSPINGSARRVIIFVWDGMRPDSISETDTPHLAALARRGTYFADNHSSYPTFTMMNAAAFATGTFSDKSGFYGNRLYLPGAAARNADGQPVDLTKPVFTEDYGVLHQLDANQDGHLLLVGTLLQAAQKVGLRTAVVGKSGPAFLQDYKNGGMLIDEKAAFPMAFAQELQAAHIALPATASLAYPDDALVLAADNGDPTASLPVARLVDGVTPDPTDTKGAPPTVANRYLMSVYLDYILPRKHPDLSIVWLRNPDSAEHPYGVGSFNYHAALKAQDELLGKLESKLAELEFGDSTDLIVVSDHGHSNVSGPLEVFPLRDVENAKVGKVDNAHGYSVSGDIRLADELTRAGFNAYDGAGCMLDPVMSGIRTNGTPLHPERRDVDGKLCGKPGTYTTPEYTLPHPLPHRAFVVASNGGSDYLYQPDHDPAAIANAVRFLQSREEFGAIFVDARYGNLPGTLPLAMVRLENAEGRNPDVVVGYSFDEHALIQGMPGIEFEGTSGGISRGMHGSFSPIDVHNTLIASGPDFAVGFTDPLPSGNVDVAPTVAKILGFALPQAEGRPLLEALRGSAHVDIAAFAVASRDIAPAAPTTGLDVRTITGTATGKSRYSFDLRVKELRYRDAAYTYFDWAKATRQ